MKMTRFETRRLLSNCGRHVKHRASIRFRHIRLRRAAFSYRCRCCVYECYLFRKIRVILSRFGKIIVFRVVYPLMEG